MEDKVMFSKDSIIPTISSIVIMGSFFVGYIVYDKTQRPIEIKPHTVVAYSMDPSVTNDGNFVLGYPGKRMDVTCNDNTTKTCFLEIEDGKTDTVKTFPYVKQEWFTPENNNRPYHTLDVIKTLPSYNGNAELKFGTDVTKNTNLVAIMRQNGWAE